MARNFIEIIRNHYIIARRKYYEKSFFDTALYTIEMELKIMKKVILGSAYIIGGILLSTLTILKIDPNTSGLILSFPFIGLVLFIIGCVLGIRGLQEDN